MYAQQVLLIRNFPSAQKLTAIVNSLFDHCTQYAWETLGICRAYVAAVFLWSHNAVRSQQRNGPPVFISVTHDGPALSRDHSSLLHLPHSRNQSSHHICPCQCAVGALVVQCSQRGYNSSMPRQWTRKGDCDGHGLFIDGVWSEQGRRERGGRGGQELHGGNLVWK